MKVHPIVRSGAVPALFAVVILVLAWDHWRLKRHVEYAEKQASWEREVADYHNRTDLISDNVGVIQFLKRGYTIKLDNASYTNEGLHLRGVIGNPFNLSISSLTLTFTARPAAFTQRDEFFKNGLLFWFSPPGIGTAQTQVGSVPAGMTAAFEIVVPNVKQTKESTQIEVQFSTERYSYY